MTLVIRRPDLNWLSEVASREKPPGDPVMFYLDVKGAALDLIAYVTSLEQALRPLAKIEIPRAGVGDAGHVGLQRAVSAAKKLLGT